jgi:hypothetical protein
MSEPMKIHLAACVEQEPNLVLLHYGDLAGEERENLQNHINECAGCNNLLQDLRRLLPLTRKADEPPATFWTDYDRELRRKLDDVTADSTWRQRLAAYWQWRPAPIFATAAVVAVALALTLGRGLWPNDASMRAQTSLLEVLPLAENLEFFQAMDVIDDLDLLEAMGNQGSAA